MVFSGLLGAQELGGIMPEIGLARKAAGFAVDAYTARQGK
jgi:hypothetical protein